MSITFKDFQQMELRIGQIMEAAIHPEADRLLVLQVDLAGEKRQLVAGIRQHYTPEELVGKRVVVVANLEPTTIRGVESQGMVLAAHDDTTLSLVTPERDIQPGSTVK